jgi:hypothetical protein
VLQVFPFLSLRKQELWSLLAYKSLLCDEGKLVSVDDCKTISLQIENVITSGYFLSLFFMSCWSFSIVVSVVQRR